MEAYLGLVLLTGLVQKQGHMSLYWSKRAPLATPFFHQCMPRDRFQLISAYLHFNDNEAIPDSAPNGLYKVRPVLDLLIGKWKEIYLLGEHIAIDEGMLKW